MIMNRCVVSVLAVLMMLSLAMPAAATFSETWVEPWSKDCRATASGGPQTIRPYAYGLPVAGGATTDLDKDGRYEGIAIGSETEDTETVVNSTIDPIFETLAAALTNTSTGGVIHLMPGVYREKVTIADSVTLRGWAKGEVVFQGACLATNGKAFDCSGSSKTIVFENISIGGYDTGIDVNSNTVRVINCEIQKCGDGIEAGAVLAVVGTSIHDCVYAGITADVGSIHVADSVIQGNEWGIEYVSSGGGYTLTVADSRILGNASEGIKVDISSGGMQVAVHRSEVTDNVGRGISYKGRNTGSVRVTDSLVSGNGSDGIYLENNAGCVTLGTAALNSIVSGCRVTGNAGDGIELKGSGTGCSGTQPSSAKVSVFQNSVAFNAGYGINGNSVSGAVLCSLGQNQIVHNVSGPENGTAVCTNSATTANQAP